MNENKYIEVKEDLKSIIDAAFYDYDDYVTDCHESGIDVTEDVEDFVADAIIKAGYVKLNATDIKDGSKSGGCENCNDHKEINTPTNTPTQNQFTNSELKQIEGMTYIVGSCEGILDEFCEKHETCAKCKAERVYNAGYRKQEWISVDERLPDITDTFLVVVKKKYPWEETWEYNVDVAVYQPFEEGYIEHWDTWNDWDEGQECHITHWMPLPEPPHIHPIFKDDRNFEDGFRDGKTDALIEVL